MRVWVSGARGKLGGEVCRQLAAARHVVVAADRTPAIEAGPATGLAEVVDLLERMGQMYARRGMTVTALRFHWILSRAELHALDGATSEAEDTRNLWGYVDLEDAARSCLLALTRHGRGEPFEALLVAAPDTRSRRPMEQLLAEHLPGIELHAPLAGRRGGFDCSRAQRLLGWTASTDNP